MLIIYPNESPRGYAIVTPTGELPIEAVALKDVPADVPFLYVEGDIPDEPDFSNPDGKGIGAEAWFQLAEKALSSEITQAQTNG